MLVAKVKKKGSVLHAYEGQYVDESQILVRFSNELFADSEDRNAMLVYLACTDVFETMDLAVLNALRGQQSSSTEYNDSMADK